MPGSNSEVPHGNRAADEVDTASDLQERSVVGCTVDQPTGSLIAVPSRAPAETARNEQQPALFSSARRPCSGFAAVNGPEMGIQAPHLDETGVIAALGDTPVVDDEDTVHLFHN